MLVRYLDCIVSAWFVSRNVWANIRTNFSFQLHNESSWWRLSFALCFQELYERIFDLVNYDAWSLVQHESFLFNYVSQKYILLEGKLVWI